MLIDFWAYSCINCQRAIPHVTAWDEAYGDAGLTVIGIHSLEYALEKEPRNVGGAGPRHRMPVALDNSLSTWTNYRNRYWPAHYLIDADATPEFGSTTPETYLSLGKVVNFGGDEEYASGQNRYRFPTTLRDDAFALQGQWELDFQNATPVGGDGRIRLNYTASEVRMVLGGSGTVTVLLDGRERTFEVGGTPQSYSIIPKGDTIESGTLEVTLTPGVEAYSFTFG